MAFMACLFMFAHQGVLLSQETEKTDSDGTVSQEIKNQDWSTLIEEILENSEDEKNAEDWQELLSELAENPISLNTATKENLESIPFLSEAQVEALSYYIYRYGPLVSLSELLLVEGMDEQELRWLKPFVCLGKPAPFPIERPSLKKAFKYGKQELRLRFGRSIQEKLGYAGTSDSTQAKNAYLGDPNQIYLRYGFNYKEKMQWGLVLEKDAGERIWNKGNGGIDYLSFHFVLRDQKRLKSFILGDYNLQFGQGLVCARSFSLGKSTTGTALEQSGTNLSRHFSASESGFFRGIGTTFILKPFIRKTAETKGKFGMEISAFGSFRKIDAAIANGRFSTISSAELHRTEEESDKKDQLKLLTMGAHFLLKTEKGQFGLTGLTYRFGASFNPEWKPYNCFYFRGKEGGNISVDYRLRYKGILFFGECAMDEKAKTAVISGLSIKPYSTLDFSFLGRAYDPEYNAYYSNSFSEGTSVKNEYGVFASCEWRLIKRWRLNAYYDVFVFPWIKYGVNAPSSGFDCAIQATWVPSSESQVMIRLKTKQKNKNLSSDEYHFPPVERQIKNQIRFQVSSTHGPWTLKTVFDGNNMETPSNNSETFGFAASQEVNCAPVHQAVSFSIRYALFDTDHFENRIYSYERDIPGAFSMPSFYGKGNRFSLLLRYKINKALNLQIKIGHSVYRDREMVGTASEQVQGNKLTDIRGMVSWKF